MSAEFFATFKIKYTTSLKTSRWHTHIANLLISIDSHLFNWISHNIRIGLDRCRIQFEKSFCTSRNNELMVIAVGCIWKITWIVDSDHKTYCTAQWVEIIVGACVKYNNQTLVHSSLICTKRVWITTKLLQKENILQRLTNRLMV